MTKTTSTTIKPLLAVLLFSMCSVAAAADITASSENGVDLCEAARIAAPGDTIVISGRMVVASACEWAVPQVTIRGTSGGTIVVPDGNRTWTIGVPGVHVEDLAFEGTTIRAMADFSARHIRVSDAETGVQVFGEEGKVAIEQSTFNGNKVDIEIGQVDQFSLANSTLSGSSAVRSKARENVVRASRFSIDSGTTAKALALADGSRNTVTGNLFYVETPEDGIFVQLSSTAAADQELVVERNTFVSRALRGSSFVEFSGEGSPRMQVERNIFWGVGGIRDIEGLADRNYIGQEEGFAGDRDFRVSSDVMRGFGAETVAESGFPLAAEAVAAEAATPDAFAAESAVSAKSVSRSAVAGLWVDRATLQATSVLGSTFLLTNRVYLNVPAPSGGMPVTITSSNPSLVSVVSPTVLVAGGATSINFGLRTFVASSSTSVTITATANGTSRSAVMTLGPVSLTSISLEETTLGSNMITIGNRVNFSGPAPVGGVTVYLTSSNPTLASVPASMTVPGGASSAPFQINARSTAVPASVTITASWNGSKVSRSFTVAPVAIMKAEALPSSVAGGTRAYVKFSLTGPAPAGMTVALRSSNPALIPVPASISAVSGATSVAAFGATASVSSPVSVTITGTNQGISKSAVVTLIPISLAAPTTSASVVDSGASVYVNVRLNGTAPAGGFPVALSTSNTALSVPSSVTVPAGTSFVRVLATARTVYSNTAVAIRTSANGVSTSTTITVTP